MARTNRRTTQPRTAKRREAIGRSIPRPTFDPKSVLGRPEFLYAGLMLLGLILMCAVLVSWSIERILVQPGQVMSSTRLKRLDFQVEDADATLRMREEASKSAPQVYKLNRLYLDRLAGSLNGLPKAVAGKRELEEVAEELRRQFQLTSTEDLQALELFTVDGETSERWRDMVRRLVETLLPANPLLASDIYQNFWAAREYAASLERLILKQDGTRVEIVGTATELRTEVDDRVRRHLRQLVVEAGFTPRTVPHVVARLLVEPQPTLLFDRETTTQLADAAAAAVETQFIQHRKGELVFRRGDVLAHKQFDELLAEVNAFAIHATFLDRWTSRIAVFGFLALLIGMLASYVALFHGRIILNPLRVLAISSLMALMLALSVVIAPKLLFVAALAPTLFVAVVLVLAYEQRLALFIGAIQAAMVTLALGGEIGWFLLQLAGVGAFVILLGEVRHRNTLIRASGITAVLLAIATFLHGMLQLPLTADSLTQIGLNSIWALASGLGVGFVVLGILPTVEQIFDITTGMTLAELRDPKQPLLRQLQQKAPGTYNHSLQVANIAEAAAEAIGANGLLVYVGAMYHDIGKMNKPEYFIENQLGGTNKHEKLSPAMSLLVIIGHVKDGVELAREYRLPRSIIQFIETHHGTTLVEYFYHAARSRAEDAQNQKIDEISFRYPGPKPRTKETAIMMLADAVESATRAVAEPNPGQIEQLVRSLSKKRLEDGQFSQCDLTLGELHRIEEAIINRVCAIHHGRIAYPSNPKSEVRRVDRAEQRASTAASA